jgi:hypothetical protein
MRRIPMKRSCHLFFTAALLALGVTACGSTVSTGGFKGESHAVAQSISNFQTDITSANEQQLCNKDLARAVRVRLSTASGGCKQALKRQISSVDDYELGVESIVVSGASATARVKSTWSGKLRLTTLQLVKEGGSWRIAEVE